MIHWSRLARAEEALRAGGVVKGVSMRRSTKAAVLAAVSLGLAPGVVLGNDAGSPQHKGHHTICGTAYPVRTTVIKRHGKRAPGRNICRQGVKTKTGVKEATTHQKAIYLRQLRQLITPAPGLMTRTAVPPARAPAGVQTASTSGYAIPHSIVMCESGGNPRAVNGSNPNRPAGLYQIITGTWQANGGGRFAGTADQASPEQQGIVAARIWNGGAGRGQWEC